jgi:hypothetical protein
MAWPEALSRLEAVVKADKIHGALAAKQRENCGAASIPRPHDRALMLISVMTFASAPPDAAKPEWRKVNSCIQSEKPQEGQGNGSRNSLMSKLAFRIRRRDRGPMCHSR